MYSIYSFPNIIAPIIGGIMMDKFGARVVIIFSSLLVAIGQIFFLLGVDIRLYYLALFGRGIYGCGGDNLDLGQSIIVIK